MTFYHTIDFVCIGREILWNCAESDVLNGRSCNKRHALVSALSLACIRIPRIKQINNNNLLILTLKTYFKKNEKKINASSGIRSHDLTDGRQVSYPLIDELRTHW